MKPFRFFLLFAAFVVLLAIPPVVLMQMGKTDLLVPHFWLIFFYISGLTLIVIITVLIVQQKNDRFYAQAFLGGTTFKILACLVFVMVFLAKNHINKWVFVSDFFYVYSLNTLFEVYGLLRNLRNQNLK